MCDTEVDSCIMDAPKTRRSESINTEHVIKTLSDNGYEFVRTLGHGTFSTVHLVRSVKYSTEFVAKVSVLEGEFLPEQESEIKALMRLSHPNIISLYSYFYDANYFYLILEYCPGGCLCEVLRKNGGLSPIQWRSYMYQIIQALKHCHEKGIAHRDLKPANILVDSYGRAKLADFGLAHMFSKGESSRGKRGSRAFLAPEILTASQFDPFIADVWALGVTMFCMAVGKIPWDTSSNKAMCKAICLGMPNAEDVEVPVDLKKVIGAALTVHPKKRATLDQLLKNEVFAEVASVKLPPLKPSSSRTLPKIPTCQSFTEIKPSATSRAIRGKGMTLPCQKKAEDPETAREPEPCPEQKLTQDMNCIRLLAGAQLVTHKRRNSSSPWLRGVASTTTFGGIGSL